MMGLSKVWGFNYFHLGRGFHGHSQVTNHGSIGYCFLEEFEPSHNLEPTWWCLDSRNVGAHTSLHHVELEKNFSKNNHRGIFNLIAKLWLMHETERVCVTRHSTIMGRDSCLTFKPVQNQTYLSLGSWGSRETGYEQGVWWSWRRTDGICGSQVCCIMEIAQGNQYLLVLNREKGLGLSQVLAGERRMQEASPAGWNQLLQAGLEKK